MSEETDDARLERLRSLLTHGFGCDSPRALADELTSRYPKWMAAVCGTAFRIIADYDAALSMLRDSTDGDDTRPLAELVAEAGLGLGRFRPPALLEGVRVHGAFKELLALARERAMAGADADVEIGRLLDHYARAFDSFDWADQLLVVHDDPAGKGQPHPKEKTMSNPNKRVHRLKTWPGPFEAVANGAKTFDVRRDDRGFVVGEAVLLEEWDPAFHQRYSSVGGAVVSGGYTKRKLKAEIVWLEKGSWGLPPDLCVLGLGSVERLEGFEG